MIHQHSYQMYQEVPPKLASSGPLSAEYITVVIICDDDLFEV